MDGGFKESYKKLPLEITDPESLLQNWIEIRIGAFITEVINRTHLGLPLGKDRPTKQEEAIDNTSQSLVETVFHILTQKETVVKQTAARIISD